MQRLAMDLRMLSRELSLYLEHQVQVGFFGSGVGLSLILGFSVAYACYYLSSIAKVSRGVARASRRSDPGGFAQRNSIGRSRRLVAGRGEWRGLPWGQAFCSRAVALPRASHGRPWSPPAFGSGPGPGTAACAL